MNPENAPSEATPNPGPTDTTMRLVAAGMFFGGLVLLGANHATSVMNGEVYPVALVMGPMVIMLGAAGLISPNILRSAGKDGKHLPLYYKLLAAAFGVLGLVLSAVLVFVVYPWW